MGKSEKISYYDRPEISNSDIGNFLFGGAAFMNQKKTRREPNSKDYFDLGEAFHCKMLEAKEFNNRFCISESKLEGLMREFVNSVIILESLGLETDQIYKLSYEKAGFKLPLERVVKEFNKPEIQAAYTFIKENEAKIHMTRRQIETADQMISSLSRYAHISTLFSDDNSDRIAYNELEIYWNSPISTDTTFDELSIPSVINCKSKIDRLIIDKKTKTVILVDLKTTSKPIFQFPSFYKAYHYYRQAAYYTDAVRSWLDKEYKDYGIEFKIVVVGTMPPYDVKLFTVSNYDIEFGRKEYKQALELLHWHVVHNQWVDRATYEGRDELLSLEQTNTIYGENVTIEANSQDS